MLEEIWFVGELKLKSYQSINFVVEKKVGKKIKANNIRSIQMLMFGMGAMQ